MNKRIVHICLGCHYTDGMGYQENYFVEQDIKDNYDVYVISDEFYYRNGELVTDGEKEIVFSNYKLLRLKYIKIINNFISSKFKKVNGIYDFLKEFKPDIIFFHGITGVELITVAKYKRNNKVKFFIDTHEDKNNSGTNLLSLVFQYKMLTTLIIKFINKYVDKYFYVSRECLNFVIKNCGVKKENTESLYLGGVFYDKQRYKITRNKLRARYGFSNENVLLVSGKFVKDKNLIDLVNCFHSFKSHDLKLLIIGDIQYEKKKVLKLIEENSNILFLGWKNKNELLDIMCCSDVYIQTSTQSASLQQASCLHNMIITYPHENYIDIFSNSAVYVESIVDLKEILLNLDNNKIKNYKYKVFKVATEKLDYDKISKIYKC